MFNSNNKVQWLVFITLQCCFKTHHCVETQLYLGVRFTKNHPTTSNAQLESSQEMLLTRNKVSSEFRALPLSWWVSLPADDDDVDAAGGFSREKSLTITVPGVGFLLLKFFVDGFGLTSFPGVRCESRFFLAGDRLPWAPLERLLLLVTFTFPLEELGMGIIWDSGILEDGSPIIPYAEV